MAKSRITPLTAGATDAVRAEFWIGEVECCGNEWTFAVIGHGPEPVASHVYHCQEAAEQARRSMFATLGRAVGVRVEQTEE